MSVVIVVEASFTDQFKADAVFGYVTPDDELHQRGEQIREARRQGLQRAREPFDHNRRANPKEAP